MGHLAIGKSPGYIYKNRGVSSDVGNVSCEQNDVTRSSLKAFVAFGKKLATPAPTYNGTADVQTLSEKVLNPPHYSKLYPKHFLRRYLDP